MESGKWLLISGTILLTVSALLGFVQHRYRDRPEVAHWRVVHAGGTAGAVQLIALSAIWGNVGARGAWAAYLSVGLIVATWAFFLGPLARALGQHGVARVMNGAGALVAVPAYLALPMILFL